MSDKYNGWTNYATWRINLEMFDGIDMGERVSAEYLEETANEYLEQSGSGITLDYARAFISDVNWDEIAEHLNEDYPQDEEE